MRDCQREINEKKIYFSKNLKEKINQYLLGNLLIEEFKALFQKQRNIY